MSSLAHTPTLTLRQPLRLVAFVAGLLIEGYETLCLRADLARSRQQLGTLDERLLRDIGIDRATARHEAEKGFFG
ncbi:MAG: DUF1127 domain-containing protein [Alphaproteobacteria bacterium]|nr:DUF1127 domain-containing protein [Alphaproteobacteria bacterium]